MATFSTEKTAVVVFATVRSIDDIASAQWHLGDNDSYVNTQRRMPLCDGIRLVGRQKNSENVQICYAASRNQEWVRVNAGHLTLARFFNSKLQQAPEGDTLNVFFDIIDDENAKYAAQQLIGAECGINVAKKPFGELHTAVQQVQKGLRALDIPCGDWTFVPMFDSFEVASK